MDTLVNGKSLKFSIQLNFSFLSFFLCLKRMLCIRTLIGNFFFGFIPFIALKKSLNNRRKLWTSMLCFLMKGSCNIFMLRLQTLNVLDEKLVLCNVESIVQILVISTTLDVMIDRLAYPSNGWFACIWLDTLNSTLLKSHA